MAVYGRGVAYRPYNWAVFAAHCRNGDEHRALRSQSCGRALLTTGDFTFLHLIWIARYRLGYNCSVCAYSCQIVTHGISSRRAIIRAELATAWPGGRAFSEGALSDSLMNFIICGYASAQWAYLIVDILISIFNQSIRGFWSDLSNTNYC